jgi:predicted amidophosphoribosyltransferase
MKCRCCDKNARLIRGLCNACYQRFRRHKKYEKEIPETKKKFIQKMFLPMFNDAVSEETRQRLMKKYNLTKKEKQYLEAVAWLWN